jgi:uncharacterized membrane protein YqjE
MEGAPDRSEGSGSLRGAVARLADSLLGLVRTRLELATIEYSEEKTRVTRQLVLLLAGVGCLLFALLFAAATFVVVFWDSYRLAALLGVILFFAVVGGFLLWRRAEIANTSPTPFAATVAEFDKDRASLTRTMNLPPS